MNLEEKIARINELYHKSQAEGLTEAEKAEQAGRKENTEKKDYVEIPPRTIALLIGKQDLK